MIYQQERDVYEITETLQFSFFTFTHGGLVYTLLDMCANIAWWIHYLINENYLARVYVSNTCTSGPGMLYPGVKLLSISFNCSIPIFDQQCTILIYQITSSLCISQHIYSIIHPSRDVTVRVKAATSQQQSKKRTIWNISMWSCGIWEVW